MNKRLKTNERADTSAGNTSRIITPETRIKDIVPEGLLEDIRILQDIYNRLDDYKKKKDADDTMWSTFSKDADSAMDNIMKAIYDMSSIAGRELDFNILYH